MADTTTQQQPPTAEEVAAIQAARRKNTANKVRQWLDGVDPWVLILIGSLTLIMWVVDVITQVRTSEALVLGTGKISATVQWGVLTQPWLLLTSQSGIDSTAWSYGWGIEIITLVWAFALEHAASKMHSVNKIVGAWFTGISVFLIGLNGYADFNNTPGDGVIQFLVAATMAFLVVMGLPVGLSLMKVGLANMHHGGNQ